MSETTSNQVFDSREAAQFLRIEHSTIFSWIKTRNLPGIRIGKLYRFQKRNLESWLDRQAATNGE